MQGDAEDEHGDGGQPGPRHDGADPGEQGHADRVGHDPDREQALAADGLGDQRDQRQHGDFGHLSDGHESGPAHAEDLVDPRRRLRLEQAQELGGVYEVELVDAADGDRQQEQRQQRVSADLAECPHRRICLLSLGRRRVRQCEAVEAQQDAEQGAEPERVGHAGVPRRRQHGLVGGVRWRVPVKQPLADRDADDDPADGPPDADAAEVTVAVGQVVERDGVGQRERGRVDDRVQQREAEERPVALERRELPDQQAADDVAQREELLGGEVPVRDLPRDPRRNDRPHGADHEHVADLVPAEPAVVREERVQQRQPRPPDGVLQEHHKPQSRPQEWGLFCSWGTSGVHQGYMGSGVGGYCTPPEKKCGRGGSRHKP